MQQLQQEIDISQWNDLKQENAQGKQALNAAIKKAPHIVRDFFVCAQDWIRTSTPFPALPPQGSASTNFATWARGITNLCKNQDMKKWTDNF